MYTKHMEVCTEAGKRHEVPGTVVIGGCELLHVAARNQTGSPAKTVIALSH